VKFNFPPFESVEALMFSINHVPLLSLLCFIGMPLTFSFLFRLQLSTSKISTSMVCMTLFLKVQLRGVIGIGPRIWCVREQTG
jgi:hypothetical protein